MHTKSLYEEYCWNKTGVYYKAHSDTYSVFSLVTQTNKLKSQVNFELLTLWGQAECVGSLPTGTNTPRECFCVRPEK